MSLFFKFIWRKVIVAFLLFLFGCASSTSPWKYESTITSKHQFDSMRLRLPFDECSYSPGMEFVKTGSQCRLYLIAPGRALTTENGNIVETTLTINEQTLCFSGILFSGGQRLLIPDDIRQELTNALCAGKKCCLVAGRHRLEIPEKGFNLLWQQFASSSPEKHSRIKFLCLY